MVDGWGNSHEEEMELCGVEWGPECNRRICTLEKGHSAIRNGFGHWCPDTAMTVTVSGPQGCGKTTLTKLLRETVEREWNQQIVAVRFVERQTGSDAPRTKLRVLADAIESRAPGENLWDLLRCSIVETIEEHEAAKEIAKEEAERPY